jgi:hypothetical protein
MKFTYIDPRGPSTLGDLSPCSGSRAIPTVATRLSARDHVGAIAVRLGIGRDRYRVVPGLYAVGSPDSESPVLVSANYKLSFDCLRKELCGLDLWILVLDTKGVNVWCSAGKGTFGNPELDRQIKRTRLGGVVRHRNLIVPQLSATGICAPAFRRDTGWTVHFGPVRANDIPAYLLAGMQKNEAMRRIEFPLAERLKLVPLEIVRPLPRFTLLLIAWILVPFVGKFVGTAPHQGFSEVALGAINAGLGAWLPVLGAVFIGSGFVPALLPWIPCRAFYLKGALAGLVFAIAWVTTRKTGSLESIALFLALPAISAWFALNFTGSSTYTSLAGVKAEIAVSRIPILTAIALGLGLQTILLFSSAA